MWSSSLSWRNHNHAAARATTNLDYQVLLRRQRSSLGYPRRRILLFQRSYQRCSSSSLSVWNTTRTTTTSWRKRPRWFGTSSSCTTSSSSGKETASSLWHQNDHPFMIGKRQFLGQYSISEMAGHVSFVGVCLAYLNTDILMLRILSLGSIALSIVFQYYRPIPLWIPIRWNFLLLQINTIMTIGLLLERHKADNMPTELETIYRAGKFETRGFSKVEFCKLFEKAEAKITMKPGETLTKAGQINSKLYFITKGKIHIERRSKYIATVLPNHFIGEMSFLNHLCEDDDGEVEDDNNQSLIKRKTTTIGRNKRIATADAVVAASSTSNLDEGDDNDDDHNELVAYVWDFDQLKEYLKGEREVRNALSAYMNHDLTAKLARLTYASRAKTIQQLPPQVNGAPPPAAPPPDVNALVKATAPKQQ